MKQDKLIQLHQQQLRNFELARKNFKALGQVVYRKLSALDFHIALQYNPARMISTYANVAPEALKARPCFLCKEHMPPGQEGIPYGEHYHIFINPYPIFEKHFTVPSNTHSPQAIDNRFEDMLNLAFDFQDYTIFYNGPECGASAPDHFHFQMAPRHIMPLEEDTENRQLTDTLCRKEFYTISTLKEYLRKVLILKTGERRLLPGLFGQIRQIIGKYIPCQQEPMINLLCWYAQDQWTVCIFPRSARRPRQFYAEGEEKIMFSPGCVDMAGLIITPREEDFRRYNIPLLSDLFGQITAQPSAWQEIITQIKTL